MKTKHTKGPWVIETQPHDSHVVIAAPFGKIAVVLLGTFDDGSSGEANARLITTAPELVEVAETFPTYPAECKHDEEPWYCDCCRHDWELALQAWNKKREAAIRKAKGE